MANKADRWDEQVVDLEQIPNIGPSIAALLRRLGINQPADLRDQNALALYEQLCRTDQRRYDLCLLDVFLSAVDFVHGKPRRPWWKYTPQRKRELAKNGHIARSRHPNN